MEAQEEWKAVVGYEGLYMVSNLGRVKSVPRKGTKGGIMKPSPDDDGYLRVKLCKNGEESMGRVHILVMRAFVGECPKNHEIDHYDWNPSNNRLENLRYLPAEENHRRKSPEWHEKMKKLHQDPEWRKSHAEAMQKLAQDTEWQKNHAEATRKARSKPVDQYTIDGEYVKTWSSATDAARELGIDNGKISNCCNGKRKKAGGFIWRFA